MPVCIGSQPANCRFAIVGLGRPASFAAEPIADGGADISFGLDKRAHASPACPFVAASAGPAANERDDREPLIRCPGGGHKQVQSLPGVVGSGIDDIQDGFDVRLTPWPSWYGLDRLQSHHGEAHTADVAARHDEPPG